MKKLLLFSSAAVIVSLSTAPAADLSRPMYTKKRAKKVLRSQRAQ